MNDLSSYMRVHVPLLYFTMSIIGILHWWDQSAKKHSKLIGMGIKMEAAQGPGLVDNALKEQVVPVLLS